MMIADGHLAQEGDVVLQSQELIDRAAAQRDAEPLHRFRQQHHEGGAHQRAHDRAEPADDDHGEEDDRAVDAEALVGDDLVVMRIERAADAGEERGEAERQRAVFGEVDAHDLGRQIVIAHRDQRAAVARAHQVGHQQIADDDIGEHDVEIFLIAAQRIAEDRERLGAGGHAAAGEPFGAGEEIQQDVLRGQRRDREIKPFQPRGGQAEDQADRRRHHARERNAEEHGDAEPVRQIGRGERAEAEEGGMADRDLAGEADQDVEAERGDAEDADLDQQAEAVFAEHMRRKADQHDAGDHARCGWSGSGRPWCPPRSWCGNRRRE